MTLFNTITESLTAKAFGKYERDFIFNTLDPNGEVSHELTPYLDKTSRPVLVRKKPFTVSFNFKFYSEILPGNTISNAMVYLTNSYTYPVILRITYTDATGNVVTPLNFAFQDPSITETFLTDNKIFAMRPISTGFTLYNNTPKMYVSGTILAAQYYSKTDHLNGFNTEMVPLNATDITSMAGYRQFDAAEGIYIVSQQVAPINAYIDVSGTINELSSTIVAFGDTAVTGSIKNRIYGINTKPVDGSFLTYRRAHDSYCRTNTAVSIPCDPTYGSWSIKISQNIEFLLHTNSPLAPSVIPNVPHDNLPLLFCQQFNVVHNGIYPAYYNDKGVLSELIVKAFVTLLPIVLPYLLKNMPKNISDVISSVISGLGNKTVLMPKPKTVGKGKKQ